MIKIAVCDDEPFMRAEMASRISGYMEENKIPCQLHCFGGGGEILGSDMAFDILFLDIQMEGMDGMEAARLMRARGYGGMLIFITVLKEEVFEAFEVRAFDYLVKPLEDSRFKRTMGRTLAALVQEPGNCLVVKRGICVRQSLLHRSFTVRSLAGRFISTRRMGWLWITMINWRIWKNVWTAGFSGATEATS